MTRLMRLPEVIKETGRSRTRIYIDMAAGRFPKSIKIGPRSIAWSSDAVQAYIESCIADSAA